MKIADQGNGISSTPKNCPNPVLTAILLGYVAEKIEVSLHAAEIKNRGGFIIEALRENYQNSEVQKARQLRAEKAREKELEDLTAEFRVKRDNIIRQAVHADPGLVEAAAKHIHSYIVRERLVEHPSAMEAYQKGGMVAAEINGILAAEFCQALLAPVVEVYEDEKARLLGSV